MTMYDTLWKIEDSTYDILRVCTNLRQIKFGNVFDQPIDILAYCPHLEQIVFGQSFNQCIEILSFCKQLRQITFNSEYKYNSDYKYDKLSNGQQISTRITPRFNKSTVLLRNALPNLTINY